MRGLGSRFGFGAKERPQFSFVPLVVYRTIVSSLGNRKLHSRMCIFPRPGRTSFLERWAGYFHRPDPSPPHAACVVATERRRYPGHPRRIPRATQRRLGDGGQILAKTKSQPKLSLRVRDPTSQHPTTSGMSVAGRRITYSSLTNRAWAIGDQRGRPNQTKPSKVLPCRIPLLWGGISWPQRVSVGQFGVVAALFPSLGESGMIARSGIASCSPALCFSQLEKVRKHFCEVLSFQRQGRKVVVAQETLHRSGYANPLLPGSLHSAERPAQRTCKSLLEACWRPTPTAVWRRRLAGCARLLLPLLLLLILYFVLCSFEPRSAECLALLIRAKWVRNLQACTSVHNLGRQGTFVHVLIPICCQIALTYRRTRLHTQPGCS